MNKPLLPTQGAVLGVVLAGGLSRRMGAEKGLLELAGMPVLAHVLAALAGQSPVPLAGVILNANGDAQRFAAFACPVVADSVPDAPGPLAGVLAGLEHAALHYPAVSHILTVSCDLPFLPPDLLARLWGGLAASPVACAASMGRSHNTITLWPVSLRARLRTALVEEGQRRVRGFMQEVGCAEVVWPDGLRDPFFNVNTPEDLATAQRMRP